MVFDRLAQSIAADYKLLLLALNGRYQQMRAPGVSVSPVAINNLRRDIFALSNTFLNSASAKISEYTAANLDGGPDGLQTALAKREVVAFSYLRSIIYENVEQVIKAARFGIGGYSDLLAGARGSVGALVQARVGQIDFKGTDAAGRRWDAEKLVFVVVRDFGYQSYLDAEVERLKDAGVEELSILFSDGSESAPFPVASFEDVRQSYFHPNSNRLVIAHVPSES